MTDREETTMEDTTNDLAKDAYRQLMEFERKESGDKAKCLSRIIRNLEEYLDDGASDAFWESYEEDAKAVAERVRELVEADIERENNRCECGKATGYYCEGQGEVEVDWVAESDRGTATAVGSWVGLTTRLNVSRECARDLIEEGWSEEA